MDNLSHAQKVKEAQRLAKQVNQRFYRLEKKGTGLKEAAYFYAKAETNKTKPRYTTNIDKIGNMSEAELNEFMLSLRKKVNSPTSSFRGLRKLWDERIDNAVNVLNSELNLDITNEGFLDFINSGGGETLNKYADSKQLVKDWVDKLKKGITTKEFISTYDRYLKRTKKPFDQAVVDVAFKKIIAKKEKKKKSRKK